MRKKAMYSMFALYALITYCIHDTF